MSSLNLTDVVFDRDDFNRIVHVAATDPDGRRLEYGVMTSPVGDSAVQTRGTFVVDGQEVLELVAQLDHSGPDPTASLMARAADEIYYEMTSVVRESDGSLSVEGATHDTAFSAEVKEGEDLPEDLPDLDDALPEDLRETLGPLEPLVQTVAASAGGAPRPRKRWWRRAGRYGCLGAAAGGTAAICAATLGIGCIAGAAGLAIAAAACVDILHD